MASRKRKKRWITRIALLLCLGLAGVLIWSNLAPTLTAQTITQYNPYTVEARDISSVMSFGGTVSILHSQSVSASESTTVREVYVESSQAVKEGDRLIQLEDGQVLTASIDGVINQLRARTGGYAMQGMTLVQVCDLENMQISMSVDEYDISKLAIGQPCTVYILSLGLTFETEISHLNRVSTTTDSMGYYTASIELTVPEEVLPGMQASVTVHQDAVTGVPALPVEAISYDEDDQPFVYLAETAESYITAPVTLGLNDGMYVEITSGLSLGDTAYYPQVLEQAQEGFSLASLYKQLFGERVVITEGERSRGGGAQQGAMPEGLGDALTQGDAPANSTEAGGEAASPDIPAPSEDSQPQQDTPGERPDGSQGSLQPTHSSEKEE